MRALLQCVSEARVTVDSQTVGSIGSGLLVLLAVRHDDSMISVPKLAEKIVHLRIFPDQEDKLNASVKDIRGEVLVVSQFTLYGDCRRGRRPSYTDSAPPEQARILYEALIDELRRHDLKVQSGIFQAHMDVSSTNHGPVTVIVDLP